MVVTGRVVMGYPTTRGTWTAHLSFLDGQRDALDMVDSFLAYRLPRPPLTPGLAAPDLPAAPWRSMDRGCRSEVLSVPGSSRR